MGKLLAETMATEYVMNQYNSLINSMEDKKKSGQNEYHMLAEKE